MRSVRKYLFGTSPLGPSRKVKAAIRKATGKINSGTDEARERFERMLFSQSGVRKESVLLGSSLMELLDIVFRALKPARVLIIGPAIDDYREAALSTGAAVETFCSKEDRQFLPDLEALKAEAGKCDLLLLANPNRITGRALADGVLSELLDIISRQGRTLVIDESFIEFVPDQGCVRRAAQEGNLIVLRTTAYYYGMPGLELAYAVSSPVMIRELRKERCGDLNLLAIEAAQTAMKDKGYRRLSALFMEEEKRLLSRVISRLPEIRMYDSDTQVILIHMADHVADIAQSAEQQGLAVASCSMIDCLGSSYLRVSIMKHEHNLKFANLLKRIVAERAEKGREPR